MQPASARRISQVLPRTAQEGNAARDGAFDLGAQDRCHCPEDLEERRIVQRRPSEVTSSLSAQRPSECEITNARFAGTERSGSRVSIFRRDKPAIKRQSFRATLCPLGQPNKAIGHESRIEPWLAIAITLLNGATKPRERTQENMIPQMSDAFGETSRAPKRVRGAASWAGCPKNIPSSRLRRSVFT